MVHVRGSFVFMTPEAANASKDVIEAVFGVDSVIGIDGCFVEISKYSRDDRSECLAL